MAVAELAGVSHQTVSRVINGFEGVRPSTKERVLTAISTLGYRRNNAARTLVTRRSGLVGVIAVGSFLFGPTRTLAAIEEAARERGYMTLLATIRDGATDADFSGAVEACLERDVEALIVIAARESLVRRCASLSAGLPVVVVGPRPGGADRYCTLSVDQELGARLAVRHLVEHGHRSITIVTGPLDWVDAQDRLRGALAECAVQGVTSSVVHGDWTAERGHEVALELTAAGAPTAVFAANDQLALGLLAGFRSRGVRVPEDVSVIGFDDVEGAAHYCPPLTTVRQDFASLGHRVLGAALALVDGTAPDLAPVPPTLQARGSVTAAGAS